MKITIIGGIIFLIGIVGSFVAREAIRAKPFEYGVSMMAGETSPIVFLAQYGIYIGLTGLGLAILSFIIKAQKKSNKLAGAGSEKEG